jgi:hypothetical protein
MTRTVDRAVGDDPVDAAAMTSLVKPPPSAPSTLTLTSVARARCRRLLRRDAAGRRRVVGDDPGDVGAVTVDVGYLRIAGNELTFATTRLASAECSDAGSMTAMPMPRPSTPECRAARPAVCFQRVSDPLP